MMPAELTPPVITRAPSRSLWFPLLAGSCVFGIVATWTLLATPRYRSSALLRIESAAGGTPLLDELKAVPGVELMGLGRDDLETEIGVLKSRRLADAVIDSLVYMVRVDPAAVPRASLVEVIRRDTTDASGRIVLTRSDRGRFSVTSSDLKPTAALPTTVGAGDTLRIGGLHLRLATSAALDTTATVTITLLRRFRAEERFDDRMEIRTQEGGSRLVQISFEDADRVLAATAVERLVAEYLRYTLDNSGRDDSRRLTELRREVATFAQRLAAAEQSLRRFKESRELVIPDEQASAQLKRIAALRTGLDELEVERTALARMLALIETRSGGGRDPLAYRQLATFPSLIANRAIQDYLMTLVALENKRSEIDVRRTGENDEVRQLTGRIGELEQQLMRVGTQYLESLDQQIGVAASSVKSISSDLAVFPQQEMEFVRLVRDRTVLTEGYVVLQRQLKQLELQTAMRSDRIRVVDAPRVADADDTAYPRITVQLLLGAILGVAVGLLVMFGRLLVSSSGIQPATNAVQKVGSASAP
ncbi:MAG: GNVR domain-containing protein [Gemmatimonadota bacterium]|nr:GNVR domain-containing protein [Gemmatimonadota bacterium]